MVIEIDKTVTAATLKHSLECMRASRAKHKKPNLARFFGALPHIGDGLELQKTARNEWS